MIQLETIISPADATNQKLSWSTSDETVATVSSDGTVSAISGGNATITGTLKNGKKVESTAKMILDARSKYPDCSLSDLYDELEEKKIKGINC